MQERRRSTADDLAFVVATVSTIEQLDALQAEWSALWERAGERNPFLSFEWTRACLDVDRRSSTPHVVTIRHHGRLVALAPLCVEVRRGFRIVRFIAEDRSDYLGLLCDAHEPGIERRLLAAVMARGDGDLVVLRRLAAPFTTLHTENYRAIARWHRTQWTTSAFGGSRGNWDALHAAGPSWFSKMRKECRRFERQGGSVQRFTGRAAADQLETVAAIEAASWKGASGVQRLGSAWGRQLLGDALCQMPEDMELWLASLHDEPVAFQINLLTPERLFLYQGAFDEAYRKSSAGSVLDYVSIEQAWRRGVREYDYLGGDEPYKAQRTTDVRTIFNMAGHARTARGWLAYATLVGPRWKLRRSATLKALYGHSKRLRTMAAVARRLPSSRSLAPGASTR